MSGQELFHRVNHIAGKLGSQDTEIVGKDDKKDAEKKTVPVFPEIFV